MMTEAGRITSVSDFKVIWCFVHVCVGVNKTFYKTLCFFFFNCSVRKDTQNYGVKVYLMITSLRKLI